MLFSCANSNAKKAGSSSPAQTEAAKPVKAKSYKLEVVAEYPHDVTSYTQGLFFQDGVMYESTGQYGSSTLRQVITKHDRTLYKIFFREVLALDHLACRKIYLS